MQTLYQPPGLFLIEGVIYSIIHSVFVFRLLLIILSVMSIILAFIWIKNDYSVNEALIVSLLLATAPIHILHSRFLNQDSLLFCLGLLSLILVQMFAKNNKKIYLFISGLLLGFGAFTKFTFLLFNFVVLSYAFLIKKISLKKASNILVGELLVIILFLLPLIIMWIKQPNSTYSITNFFGQYASENVGDSEVTVLTTIFYIGKSFVFLGIGLIIFIYSLFAKKDYNKNYLFLIYWVLLSIIILSLSTKAQLRYLLIQNLVYIPLFLIVSNTLLKINKKIAVILVSLILCMDFYYYYIFITNPTSLPEFIPFFVETKPFLETIAYLRPTMTVNDSLITNEPYLFMPMSFNAYSANYENNILCPTKNVKYLVLVNSSLGFNLFNYMGDVNRLTNYYTLDRVISNNRTTFFIYNVTGSIACSNLVPPLKRALYLRDII